MDELTSLTYTDTLSFCTALLLSLSQWLGIKPAYNAVSSTPNDYHKKIYIYIIKINIWNVGNF